MDFRLFLALWEVEPQVVPEAQQVGQLEELAGAPLAGQLEVALEEQE
jgi:hypothetical protein